MIKCSARCRMIGGCFFGPMLHKVQTAVYCKLTLLPPDGISMPSSPFPPANCDSSVCHAFLTARSTSDVAPPRSTPILPLSGLELNHSDVQQCQSNSSRFKYIRPDSPLCPLLVEHTTPTVLAPDGVGLLEVGRGAAVAAQILHLHVVVAEVGVEGAGLGGQCSAAEAAARGAGWDLVAFAGHVQRRVAEVSSKSAIDCGETA